MRDENVKMGHKSKFFSTFVSDGQSTYSIEAFTFKNLSKGAEIMEKQYLNFPLSNRASIGSELKPKNCNKYDLSTAIFTSFDPM